MFAHERNFDGGPEFVTAHRYEDRGHREWRTWCQPCAVEMNLDLFRRQGWTLAFPEGFVEGEACDACSREREIPLGYPNNGESRWVYDENNRFVGDNPNFKSWKCEECDGTGWQRAPVAKESGR
jgi:hypothetical protein